MLLGPGSLTSNYVHWVMKLNFIQSNFHFGHMKSDEVV